MKAGYIAIFMTMVAWLIVSAARFKPAPIVSIAPELDIYERAELVTGAPAEILRAIAIVESNEGDNQVGDGGRSHGRFQINETYRDERIKRYGEYDPHDSLQAAIIAGHVLMHNLEVFGDTDMAIAAYRQGVRGVQKYGVQWWYVDRVRKYINKGGGDDKH